MSKKVLLGLSGGVDSAIAGYLLKQQGYNVTGCFMRNWDSIANNDINGNPTLNGSKCSQEIDYDDAVCTAKEIDIPLIRFDFIKEYWDEVFSFFISEYHKGRTPNPDIFCNKYIKFQAFREKALELGYDYIAMGHYAKKVEGDGFSYLFKARDKAKDQSYFLAQINEEQLAMSLFPLADITKLQVRELASKLNLTIAKKKDSTGVCFIGERHFRQFLQNYIPAQPGKIIDVNSRREVGQHEGVYFYTIGQHRGLSIGGQHGLKNLPFFVVGKDVEHNILFVGQTPDNYARSYALKISHLNWLVPNIPFDGSKFNAKFRYRSADQPVTLRYHNEEVFIEYPGYTYITPGQLAVLYDGDKLVGSGIIEELYRKDGSKLDFSGFLSSEKPS